ncbi:MAG: hypothetical protein CJBNEKGG_01878 [Prosthecobacter sp.]|nr:hypothetical protein [Prosthecobacter sp.]
MNSRFRLIRFGFLGLAFLLLLAGTSQSRAATSPVAPVLLPFTPDTNGVVSGEISYQLEYTGTVTRFSQGGLPRGLNLDTKTGAITGRPEVAGTYTIHFTAYNGTAKSNTLSLEWTVEPLPEGTVGTYHALLDRHSWYNGGYGGSLKLTVASTGRYTGVITRGVHRNTITGRLDTVPGGLVNPAGGFEIPRRSPYDPLEVAFTLPIGSASIIGTLQEPGGDVIQLAGYRASTSTPTFAGAQWNSSLEISNSLLGDDTYPQGAGWAVQKFTKTGIGYWTLRLADGTSSTFSTALGSSGQVGVHLMLYNNAGSLQGYQVFDPNSGLTAGSLGWIKSAFASRSYAAGFPLHYLTATGARYTPPTAGSMIFGITPGTSNVRLVFSEAGLGSPYTQLFSLGTGNRVTIPTGTSANPYGIRFSINFSTGLITGTGTAMDYVENQPQNSRSGSFSALLIPGREQAVGHFLLPTSRSSTSAILSGSVIGEEVNN